MSLCDIAYAGPAPKTKAAAAKIRKTTMKACAKQGCARCALALAGTPPPSLAEEQAHIYGPAFQERMHAGLQRAQMEANRRLNPFTRATRYGEQPAFQEGC